MNMPLVKSGLINKQFYDFINQSVLPLVAIEQASFWQNCNELLNNFGPRNRQLLQTRDDMQAQLDEWHLAHKDQPIDQQTYQSFLRDIDYLQDEGPNFQITTQNVDQEIATIAGPQLVVPLKNARFALNAANARWGSLYDALYGTDVIAKSDGLKTGKHHNQARGNHVINYAKNFLDQTFPLDSGSHHDVISYLVYYQHLLAMFPDGSTQGLKNPRQFVALSGHKSDPTELVLKNNGLHVVVEIDRTGTNGTNDLAGINDIQMEAALTTIMDFEDSVAAVDAQDKLALYKHWLGLMQGDLTCEFDKNGVKVCRQLNKDRHYTSKDGEVYDLKGRSTLLARNVGHLMTTELMQDEEGHQAPEGLIDTLVTALIGMIDLKKQQNSQTGSIYIVKPKMHGPDEVRFTCDMFNAVEDMLNLKRNTLKLGIMDEERRTTVNLKECIRVAKARIVFINTGFLDRTGDEIHTGMQAGPFLRKADIKTQPWISAYEDWNVDVGLACGFAGKAQIGKGMWAMPDEMARMVKEKVNHPLSGANTAWVPSPSAAVLHAMHYHQVDVIAVQQKLQHRQRAKLDDILTLPLMKQGQLSFAEIEKELANNIQSILGYVVRWIDNGIGCSKVPDINNTGLMEDRATLRISSQHIANWLRHGICTQTQVNTIMQRMALVVDKQNQHDSSYSPMTPDSDNNLAMQAAKQLIFKGLEQPNGYTEPTLHDFRQQAK